MNSSVCPVPPVLSLFPLLSLWQFGEGTERGPGPTPLSFEPREALDPRGKRASLHAWLQAAKTSDVAGVVVRLSQVRVETHRESRRSSRKCVTLRVRIRCSLSSASRTGHAAATRALLWPQLKRFSIAGGAALANRSRSRTAMATSCRRRSSISASPMADLAPPMERRWPQTYTSRPTRMPRCPACLHQRSRPR